MDAPPMHDALRPLEFLLGTWRGTGTGRYPGIDDFEYGEESRFWRPAGPGVEVVLAHAFGITEILGGRLEGRKLTLRSEALTSAPTAKRVEAVARTLEVAGAALTYHVEMAFGDHELQPHLRAELKRDPVGES